MREGVALPEAELEQLGRLLARWLTPYIKEGLGAPGVGDGETHQQLSHYTPDECASYVHALGDSVLAAAETFFGGLAAKGENDSLAVARALGLDTPRKIPAVLTTPLKRRAKALGWPYPWHQDDERERTVWIDRDGTAARMLVAIREERTMRARRR
jgi:hypothetical protein